METNDFVRRRYRFVFPVLSLLASLTFRDNRALPAVRSRPSLLSRAKERPRSRPPTLRTPTHNNQHLPPHRAQSTRYYPSYGHLPRRRQIRPQGIGTEYDRHFLFPINSCYFFGLGNAHRQGTGEGSRYGSIVALCFGEGCVG